MGAGRERRRAATIRALTATADDGALIGMVPVVPLWRSHRIPLPVLVTADPFRSLDTPLLDRDRAEQAATRLMAQARDAGAHALLLRYVALDGVAAQAFTRVAAQQGLRPRVLQSWSRACLDATPRRRRCARRGLSGKKLKELRRLRHRLAEHGEVSFAVARDRDDVARAFDQFLTLEACGWKGRRGTALMQQPELAERLRRAALSLAAQGRCEIVTLCSRRDAGRRRRRAAASRPRLLLQARDRRERSRGSRPACS